MFLRLPSIDPEARRSEEEFWNSFKQLRPRILGGLLDALVGAVRELPSVRLSKLPRMADFARFGEAVGRGMGWPPETFLSAYFENRKEASESTLEDSPIAMGCSRVRGSAGSATGRYLRPRCSRTSPATWHEG